VGGVLLICPGHVPGKLAVGTFHILLDKGNHRSKVGLIGRALTRRTAGLLHGDDIPFLIENSVENGGIGLFYPIAAGIFEILVRFGARLHIVIVCLKRASADIKIAEDHVLDALSLGDIIKIRHGVDGKAVSNG